MDNETNQLSVNQKVSNEENNKSFKILNKVHLQLIAALAMTIDHLTWILFPGYPNSLLPIILHIIGRLAFPIFAFFIALGYHYTHDKRKYILRILFFSLISHVPYMMSSVTFQKHGWLSLIPFCTGEGIERFLNQGSVLFSYFIGLVMLVVNDSKKLKTWQKTFLIILLCFFSFPCDWSCIGSMIVLVIGINKGFPLKQILWSIFYIACYSLVYFFALDKIYGLVQWGVLLALPLLYLYNGKKSQNPKVNKAMKYFLYIYYPVHLLILGIISLFL